MAVGIVTTGIYDSSRRIPLSISNFTNMTGGTMDYIKMSGIFNTVTLSLTDH